jgi:hypothetical protein
MWLFFALNGKLIDFRFAAAADTETVRNISVR